MNRFMLLMYRIWIGMVACMLVSDLYSQMVLFPGLEGEELQDALRDAYRPSVTLSLAQAKDSLYEVIDNEHDSVSCVYSGYTLVLPDGVDASQWLFMNGDGLNLEHVFPQSKGADEGQAGHSNMHHLYPSRVDVNETRAAYPFADIPDNVTTSWYKDHLTIHSIPGSDIDAYSEYRKGLFEPRESVKGNIARAMMYFYTMYKEDADAADPNFFATQRLTLCQWHLNDPVNDEEQTRSTQVAHYQQDKENPFVLDCTAALRAWCPEFQGCNTTLTYSPEENPFRLSAYVNAGRIIVHLITEDAQTATISVYDISGQVVHTTPIVLNAGISEYDLRQHFIPGVYIITCRSEKANWCITRVVVQ